MSLVNSNISITQFDSENWVLNSGQKNILVNTSSLALVRILQDSNSYDEAKEAFQKGHGIAFEKEEFLTFVENCFKGKGVLLGDETATTTESYVNAQVDIIPSKLASVLAKPFKFLYSSSTFGLVAFLLVGFVVSFFMNYTSFLSLNYAIKSSDFIPIIIITGFSTLVHELGHIAALNKNGIKENGSIGFGFYSIIPVAYSDVSMAWKLKKHERIIVNLGGIVSEITFAIILYGLFFLTHKDFLLVSTYTVVLHALFQLNPFMRSDGYWIVSDGLGLPNLLPKSKQMINDLFDFKNKSVQFKDYKEMFIFCYGIINYLIFAWFIYYSVSNHIQGIIRFPSIILDRVFNLVNLDFAAVKVENIWILYIGFYLMVYNYGFLILRFIGDKLFTILQKARIIITDKSTT